MKYMPFSKVLSGKVFIWAGWYWMKTDNDHAASYDQNAQQITGKSMTISPYVIVEVL